MRSKRSSAARSWPHRPPCGTRRAERRGQAARRARRRSSFARRRTARGGLPLPARARARRRLRRQAAAPHCSRAWARRSGWADAMPRWRSRHCARPPSSARNSAMPWDRRGRSAPRPGVLDPRRAGTMPRGGRQAVALLEGARATTASYALWRWPGTTDAARRPSRRGETAGARPAGARGCTSARSSEVAGVRRHQRRARRRGWKAIPRRRRPSSRRSRTRGAAATCTSRSALSSTACGRGDAARSRELPTGCTRRPSGAVRRARTRRAARRRHAVARQERARSRPAARGAALGHAAHRAASVESAIVDRARGHRARAPRRAGRARARGRRAGGGGRRGRRLPRGRGADRLRRDRMARREPRRRAASTPWPGWPCRPIDAIVSLVERACALGRPLRRPRVAAAARSRGPPGSSSRATGGRRSSPGESSPLPTRLRWPHCRATRPPRQTPTALLRSSRPTPPRRRSPAIAVRRA